MSYDINLPSYTIGTDAYKEIAKICRPYGTNIVAIGGHKAIEAAKDKINNAIEGTELNMLGYIWYGGEASYENVEALEKERWLQHADMIFAIGGGKATDTAKALANTVKKPVFTFPTIASNCSACTSVSIMYNQDGSFKNPFFFDKPPVHAFIDTEIIVNSPKRYMWAGIGDTYAKYFESSVSSRDEEVPHYIALGVTNSRMCFEPVMKYGVQALIDNEAHIASKEYEQVVLAIIVSTAIASILLCTDHVIDYNTGLAHAIFYALTSFPQIERNHLHGEVVGYGVLILLLVDKDMDSFKRVYQFNRAVGLPTKLADVELTLEELPKVVRMAAAMKDIDHNPYKITEEMLTKAFIQLENIEK